VVDRVDRVLGGSVSSRGQPAESRTARPDPGATASDREREAIRQAQARAQEETGRGTGAPSPTERVVSLVQRGASTARSVGEGVGRVRDATGDGGLDRDPGPTRGADPVERADPARRRDEQFGDVAIRNPASGRRVEAELEETAGTIDAATEVGVRAQLAGASAPAIGTTPVDLAIRAAQTEQDVLRFAEAVGLDQEADAVRDVTPGEAGPIETAGREFLVGSGQALNPASLALDVKEAAEFAATQPDRLLEPAGESALVGAAQATLPGQTTAGLARTGGAVTTEGPLLDESESEDFAADVASRGRATVDAAERDLSTDPVGASAGAAGALVTGAAVGRGAGSTALRAARLANRADVDVSGSFRRFAGDERGQLQVGQVDPDTQDVDVDAGDTAPTVDRGDREILANSPRDLMSDEVAAAAKVQRRQLSPDETPQADPLAGRSAGPTFDQDVVDDARLRAQQAMQPDSRPLSQRFGQDPVEADVSGVDDVARTVEVSATGTPPAAAGAGAGVDEALARREQAAAPTVEVEATAPPGADVDTTVADTTTTGVGQAAEQPVDADVDTGPMTVEVTQVDSATGNRLDDDVDVRPREVETTRPRTDDDVDVRVRDRRDTDPRTDVDVDTRTDTDLDTPVDVDPDVDVPRRPGPDPDPDVPRRLDRDPDVELVAESDDERDDEPAVPFDERFVFEIDVPTGDDLTSDLDVADVGFDVDLEGGG
jgi:hypothetical protein